MELADSNITKRALSQALKELIKTRPIEKISVGNICDACGLNRKSFYYHFQDKYELIYWIYCTEFLDAGFYRKSDSQRIAAFLRPAAGRHGCAVISEMEPQRFSIHFPSFGTMIFRISLRLLSWISFTCILLLVVYATTLPSFSNPTAQASSEMI